MNPPDDGTIVNDVTRLNPVRVWAVAVPTSVEDVQDAVRRAEGPVSIGGGHFSMGGQTASPGSLHLDMRRLNQVLAFHPQQRTIRVQAGIRWCDIQRFIDPHDLSVRIMQTYANFTVGGSLSVNVHGRYVGLGPLILSVNAIRVVLADGELVEATPTRNSELFHGVVGGYGGLGVIVEAELQLAPNLRVQRDHACMPTRAYARWFREHVRSDATAVFHNADLYPPQYRQARAVSWRETNNAVTVPHRLQPVRRHFPLQRYFFWAFTETPGGKWRRQHIIDRLLYLARPVHWRNYEAGYDVAELEPATRRHRTYVLQEYFIPVARFDEFVPKMAEILSRHRVNAVNVSVRHAFADPGSLLAWAREEVFAFVLYYKQRTRDNAKARVAVWTRELIDAALDCGGTYYLPYQPHATPEQFHRAYPRARELFELKRKLDPDFRWRNVLWDTYYAPTLEPMTQDATTAPLGPDADFKAIYATTRGNDDFYRFLQNVYRLYPEDRFHALIQDTVRTHHGDEAIYRALQAKVPGIKPFLSELTYALPSLGKQKREMSRQTLQLLGDRRTFDGYLEIGSTGRYVSDLRKHLTLRGDVVLLNDIAPTNSPVDIVERGGLRKIGRYVPMDDYAPIAPAAIADASIELATCYIGLHHIPLDRIDTFIASLHRVVKPGGLLILRDHDVTDEYMRALVALAHIVFNAGLGTPWETNARELRHFRTIDAWVEILQRHGFIAEGPRLLQAHDPTINTLLCFRRA
ncbi:FAD-binding protein [Lysobacter sp. CFH 32150]|uniref:FAD-binding protein n=1 Tax=Lysobacter sp. CFH 32150 TaxID=2927128 RepID=UPI001FA72B33|nr:FAD-binding protein [Lysobacter sp. CFH 32150]MCI4568274.1 FAD-binding protein [Lysobacter sp. CFH 32150]